MKAANAKSASSQIQSLKVGDKVYSGDSVPPSRPQTCPTFILLPHTTIKKICSAGLNIPDISPRDATELL